MYFLPLLKRNNELFIFTQNYFYENWANIQQNKLIEFILPLENIEIIQQIKDNEENLLNISLDKLFQGYNNKNLAMVLIQLNNSSAQIFFKTKILEKNINKSIKINKLENFAKDVNKKITFVIEKRNYKLL